MSNNSLKSIPTSWWVGGAVAVAVTLLIGGLAFLDSSGETKSTREVALACTTDLATRFHIHSQLKIVINGESRDIPADIGISPTCMNSLHTHDTSGEIHVESPQKRDFTLADFFAVWGKSFTKDQILDSTVDDRHVIRVTVNGNEAQEYENTVLRDEDQIVISYEEKK